MVFAEANRYIILILPPDSGAGSGAGAGFGGFSYPGSRLFRFGGRLLRRRGRFVRRRGRCGLFLRLGRLGRFRRFGLLRLLWAASQPLHGRPGGLGRLFHCGSGRRGRRHRFLRQRRWLNPFRQRRRCYHGRARPSAAAVGPGPLPVPGAPGWRRGIWNRPSLSGHLASPGIWNQSSEDPAFSTSSPFSRTETLAIHAGAGRRLRRLALM